MKKINMIEAMQVVGGTCKTCTTSYATGSGAGKDLSCYEITNCVDKYGTETNTYKRLGDETTPECKDPI